MSVSLFPETVHGFITKSREAGERGDRDFTALRTTQLKENRCVSGHTAAYLCKFTPVHKPLPAGMNQY
jgi:hypothetical protein